MRTDALMFALLAIACTSFSGGMDSGAGGSGGHRGGSGGGGGGTVSCPNTGSIQQLNGCLNPRPECDVERTWLLGLSDCISSVTLTVGAPPAGCGHADLSWLSASGCAFHAQASETSGNVIAGQCFSCTSQLALDLDRTDGGLVGSGSLHMSGECSCSAQVTVTN